ncbi:cell division protein ZapA [Paraferrimonas sedimenticola]|uniref:Cell division protein ZapA n=2 Tax=Paraferrimonas sedimenticola TaxID=375674 RepID=A0AA37W0K6_9GAMM|nr:cell division protein ZapA [Paraferrimonas sedimenticola]
MGRVFSVSCPDGEEEALQAVARDLDDKMRAIRARTHCQNREELAVMAALQLGYDLSKEKNRNQNAQQAFEERILLLQRTLEEALVEHAVKAE